MGSYTLFPPFPLPQAEASKGKATGEGRAASVCWRTEVAARIGLVPIEQWEGLVDGTLEDDEDVGERVQEKVRFWVKAMHEEARRSVEVLEKMGGEPRGILRIFGDGDDDKSTGATRQSEPGRNLNVEIEPGYSSANPDANADTILKREIEAPLPISASVAQRRYDLVLTRYRQILETCDSYLCI